MSQDPNTENYLVFTQGKINVAGLEFEGYREAGENHFFETDYHQPVKADLTSGAEIPDFSFDVPQGVYSLMKMNIELEEEYENEQEETRNPEALVFEGSYSKLNGTTLPVRFETAEADEMELTVKNSEGLNRIVLSEDVVSEIEIKFDFNYCFRWVEREDLEEAEISNINGTAYLLINEEKNSEMYSEISSRLKDSAFARQL